MKRRRKTGKRKQPDKDAVKRRAAKEGRKVLWYHPDFGWRAATNRMNTPLWATQTEDIV